MKKILGFTGTQLGITREQASLLIHIFGEIHPELFVHGDCIGADSNAHDIAAALGIPVWIHPPLDEKKRAFKQGDFYEEPKAYIERNHNIVDGSTVMVACPNSYREQLRSGTWATVRYAQKQGKKVLIIYPDGSLG